MVKEGISERCVQLTWERAAEPSGCRSPALSSGLCALKFEPSKDRILKAGPLPNLRACPGPL